MTWIHDDPRTWVYVLRGPLGSRSLYVGVTNHPRRRISEHRKHKPWWPEVERIGWLAFATREHALGVEAFLIRYLKPVHNVDHKPWREQGAGMYLEARDVPVLEVV